MRMTRIALDAGALTRTFEVQCHKNNFN
jgi:hypothetical protein